MKKKTITKAVVLTATILMLTGCNSSTGVNPTTVPETSSAIEQEVTTSTEQGAETNSNQETETSSIEETTTTTTGADEPTIPETTAGLENVTQVAGYDGICGEYGHVAYDDYEGIEYFCMEEGAPIAAWKDAWSKYKYVGTDEMTLLRLIQYKGHDVPVCREGYGFDEDEDFDAYNGTANYMFALGYVKPSPFTYDIDLNIVCSDLDWCKDYVPEIMAQEVRDGVTWYEYERDEGYYYWFPEHNGADWEQVYKKYVEEPYEAAHNSMTDEERVSEELFIAEQVWNKTYYNVYTDGEAGHIAVSKMYAYKNADGSITQSDGWERCDSSIFEGTSLLEHGSIENINGKSVWQMDGDALYIRGNGGIYRNAGERVRTLLSSN